MQTSGAPEKQFSDEAQLLKEGWHLVTRAVRLSTETHKIKVWVPVLCSMILTAYYLYGLHRKNSASMDLSGQAQQAAPAPQVVAETPAPGQRAAAVAEDRKPASTPSATPEVSGSYADLQKQAEQAHTAQQFGEEAKLWQQFMERSPVPQAACPAIGKAYERAGEADLSIQAYEKCVSLEPGNLDTLAGFAHVLETEQDFNRALSLYRQVLLKDARNLDAQTGIALVELRQNHLPAADEAAKNVLGKAPDNTDALLIAGIVAWRQARVADAERIFLRGAALDDGRADFHAFLGRIAEAERHPHEALRQYDKALALDPGDADIAGRRERLQGTR